MLETQTTTVAGGRVTKISVLEDSKSLSYRDAIQRWQLSEEFRTFFISLLAASPYVAYRWEVPAVTSATAERAFEFVLLDYPRLKRQFDESTFGQYFDDSDVVTFLNLRGDAPLVVPCPRSDATDRSVYAHLAAFVRGAPTGQVHAFWQAVGKAMDEHMSDPRFAELPIWLSTAGMGVAWLHVRLDSQPKYYGYTPYKSRP
ncbi:MAG: hypothetical protein IT422_22120 [Pirellulaceae bacterium]|nr:hypothetical protein [Pirellulaceae bacterium]